VRCAKFQALQYLWNAAQYLRSSHSLYPLPGFAQHEQRSHSRVIGPDAAYSRILMAQLQCRFALTLLLFALFTSRSAGQLRVVTGCFNQSRMICSFSGCRNEGRPAWRCASVVLSSSAWVLHRLTRDRATSKNSAICVCENSGENASLGLRKINVQNSLFGMLLSRSTNYVFMVELWERFQMKMLVDECLLCLTSSHRFAWALSVSPVR
jgi:hypothetical protein